MVKLYFVYGGKSVEHDVAIMSTRSALSAVDFSKYEVIPVYVSRQGEYLKGAALTAAPSEQTALKMTKAPTAVWRSEPELSLGTAFDFNEWRNQRDAIIFPMIHGTNGEDGTIEGLFEVLDVPYVGDELRASAVCMDKIMSKILFDEYGIPQVPYVAVLYSQYQTATQQTQLLDHTEAKLTYPMFVKPANAGSSIGISRVTSRAELASGLTQAFKYDERVVIEQGISPVRELAVGVLGNQELKVSVVGEIGKKQDFYDYESKFVDGSTRLIIPASISTEQVKAVQDYAVKSFQAMGANGLARVDFFLAPDGQLYLNEAQTMPGFTEFSMYPYLFQASGMSYQELLDELIKLGFERYEQKHRFMANF